MSKEEIIERVTNDGIKSAYAMFQKDLFTSNSYHDDMVLFRQSYPNFSVEIQAAYDEAFKNEYAKYKRSSYGLR